MNRKTLRPLAISMCILFIFTGCQKNRKENKNSRITVTASFYPLYTTIMNIVQDVPGVDLQLLAPAQTGCLHDYQLTVNDMKKIAYSDLLVLNGMGMEPFLENAKKNCKGTIVNASDGFRNPGEALAENSHIWLSAEGTVYQARKITQALMEKDPEYAEAYLDNFLAYEATVDFASEGFSTRIDSISSGWTILSFHEAFSHFAQEHRFSVWEVEEDEENHSVDPKTLSSIIDAIKDAQKKGQDKILLVAEKDSESSAATTVSRETGLNIIELDPLTKGELKADAWIEAMKSNIAILEENITK